MPYTGGEAHASPLFFVPNNLQYRLQLRRQPLLGCLRSDSVVIMKDGDLTETRCQAVTVNLPNPTHRS
jgi:hypothetical protein